MIALTRCPSPNTTLISDKLNAVLQNTISTKRTETTLWMYVRIKIIAARETLTLISMCARNLSFSFTFFQNETVLQLNV